MALEEIKNALEDEDWLVRCEAVQAFQGREVPMELLERALKDESCLVRCEAVQAFQGREVPMELLERALKDAHWLVRCEAVQAFQGREVPMELLERALKDENWWVRSEAFKAFEERGRMTMEKLDDLFKFLTFFGIQYFYNKEKCQWIFQWNCNGKMRRCVVNDHPYADDVIKELKNKLEKNEVDIYD